MVPAGKELSLELWTPARRHLSTLTGYLVVRSQNRTPDYFVLDDVVPKHKREHKSYLVLNGSFNLRGLKKCLDLACRQTHIKFCVDDKFEYDLILGSNHAARWVCLNESILCGYDT